MRAHENLPMKWAICHCCDGNGRLDNPAFSNGITSSEWHDEWDADERRSYLRGDYDVDCTECGGSGKVRVPDVARMTFAQKRQVTLVRREERQQAQWARESAADYAAERRMGA